MNCLTERDRHAIRKKIEQMTKRNRNEIMNKAGYTATPVACGWSGAIIEVRFHDFSDFSVSRFLNLHDLGRNSDYQLTDPLTKTRLFECFGM